MEKNIQSEDNLHKRRLQILGNVNGQFANIDYTPRLQVRDFIFFHMI